MNKLSKKLKKADQYNDPKHNYLQYWQGRDYEHAAEEAAIKRLLKDRHFDSAVDIGGGYGRLSVLLADYADRVVLAEPSQQQLDLAKTFLRESPKVMQQLLQADSLGFKDHSIDLAVMVRVMHHLPDPAKEFNEVSRVLKKDGYFILEVANYAHGRNRLKHLLKGQKLPKHPIDIRSPQNKRDDEIAFVNHNPRTVIKQLDKAGFKVERVLSVSNLRSPKIKKVLPKTLMLSVEKILQPTLSKTFFGPSVFFLLHKTK